jgi:hypothetical protein
MAKGVMQSCASTRHEAAPVPCVRDGTAQFATPSRSSSGPVRVKCLSVSIAYTPFLHDPRAKELGGGPDSMTSRDTRGNSIGNGGFQRSWLKWRSITKECTPGAETRVSASTTKPSTHTVVIRLGLPRRTRNTKSGNLAHAEAHGVCGSAQGDLTHTL